MTQHYRARKSERFVPIGERLGIEGLPHQGREKDRETGDGSRAIEVLLLAALGLVLWIAVAVD